MKICYLIIAHKNPKQLNLLIDKLLSYDKATVYLHIGLQQYNSIKNLITKREHLYIIEKPIKVEWGGDNILRAQLLLLNESKKENADYYQFLTGQDFPIKNDLPQFLSNNLNQVFMDAEESPKEEKIRLKYYWPHVLSKMYNNKFNIYRIIRKTRMLLLGCGFPGVLKKINFDLDKIQLYKSMFWITLDNETSNYILQYLEENPDYFSVFENALNAEEGFWATTIMNNDKYKSKVVRKDTLIYTSEFTNNHPKTLTMKDVNMLDSSNYYFARKFDMEVDKEVLQHYYNK